jgi:prepilin-type N-terminal cleavage/methylation domain-containing protein
MLIKKQLLLGIINKKGGGFTLLELLVSSAILSIVLAVLLAILSTSLTTWRVTQNDIDVDVEARSGNLLLMQDIDNIILPKDPRLWPSVQTNNNIPYFRFLTLKPLDYQDFDGNDNVGDVCYVEYSFQRENPNGDLVLMRSFYSSKWTYDNVIKNSSFPPPNPQNAQLLSTNILAELKDSVRSSNLYGEAAKTGFVLLATNNPGFRGQILPMQSSLNFPNPSNPPNPPVGIEINFSTTDMTSIKNLDLLQNPNYKLRSAGYFSLRFDFPNSL